jgi:tRNA A-37 threonylcarbamoyl transferase component Bud32
MPDNLSDSSLSPGHLESILAEIMVAEEQGRIIDEADYLGRFPEYAGPLREYFDNRRRLAALVPTVVLRNAEEPETTCANRVGLEVGSEWGNFFIEEELGRGSMGIVYRARQLKPERQVALKVIRMDRLASLPDEERRQWLDRFQREAQLVAALDRPDHIVSLYEVGEQAGQSYFTMRLVTGGTLAARLKQMNEGEPALAQQKRVRGQRNSARLLARVARAVHYAHQRGVLHRDLKPSNILLDEQGQPLVSDFGLARRVDQTGSLVQSGIEGTAEYMSPEQARAEPGAATTAADVYSLGAILYECLTGRPPFQGKSPVETLLLVLNEELTPPRSLDPRLDQDLETICRHCLQKESGRRYSSAAALADDLDNWLAGRPINARPTGPIERLWRWCRRNPVPAAAAALIAATVAIAFVLISLSRNEALELADKNEKLADQKGRLADEKSKLATANERLAKEKANEAARATMEANRAKQEEKKARREAIRLAFQQATVLSNQDEVSRTMHVLAHGLMLAEQAEETDLERLFRANLAAWRYHLHELRRVLPHTAGVSAVAWSPDGRILATACFDQKTRLWDAASGRLRGEPIKHHEGPAGHAFSPDLKSLAFSPDGKFLLAVGYAKVGVWNVQTLKRVADLDHNPAIVTSAAFAPDSRTILTGSTDGKAQFWDTSGKKIGEPLFHPEWIEAVAFAPDGRFFAAGGKEGHIFVWETAARQRPFVTLEHPGGVTALALGAEGRLLSGGADRTARLWNYLGSSRIASMLLGHQAIVKAVAFNPDGSLVGLA